jgi:transposase
MARRARRNHTPAFKAKAALAAIKGEKTLSELAQQFDVHANQIKQWRDQLLEGAVGVFGSEARIEGDVTLTSVYRERGVAATNQARMPAAVLHAAKARRRWR